jgi:hypothetical protein
MLRGRWEACLAVCGRQASVKGFVQTCTNTSYEQHRLSVNNTGLPHDLRENRSCTNQHQFS